jgi:hypothetical protein
MTVRRIRRVIFREGDVATSVEPVWLDEGIPISRCRFQNALDWMLGIQLRML